MPDSFPQPVRLDTVPSTNDAARRLAERGAPHGLAVIARTQTAGRGRRGHGWHSPPGGLYASFVLRPPAWPATRAPILAPLAGLAVFRALRSFRVPSLLGKSPNDVLAAGRKIAGILVEPRISSGTVEFAVVGIGVNLAQTAADFPPPLDATATSARILGLSIAPGDLFPVLATGLLALLPLPPDAIAHAWHLACTDPAKLPEKLPA
jgi:BirA family biotin operon repressor/biotin-[acetyl-CoA-carboxylase] ligase